MDSAYWERIQVLFHEAADRPASQREAFLKSSCGDDPALIADVLAMLEEDLRGQSVLDRTYSVKQIPHQPFGNLAPIG